MENGNLTNYIGENDIQNRVEDTPEEGSEGPVYGILDYSSTIITMLLIIISTIGGLVVILGILYNKNPEKFKEFANKLRRR